MLTMSTLATEHIKVAVAGEIDGEQVDPTLDTVSMAVVAEGEAPESADFTAASWETDATQAVTVYYAKRLVATPTAGRYDVWIKLVHGAETIVRQFDQLLVR